MVYEYLDNGMTKIQRDYMTKTSERRINFFAYLLNIIIKPTSNIKNNTYVFWLWNVIFLVVMVPVFGLAVLQANFSAASDETGLATVFGFIIFLLVMNTSVDIKRYFLSQVNHCDYQYFALDE